MKLIKQLFLGLTLIFTVSATAQTGLKFGHVNTQAILTNMPELKTIDEQLKAEYEKLEAQLTDMQEALKKLQTDYITKLQSNALAAEERTSMETQIQEGNQKVQTFYAQSQQSLRTKEQELKKPVFDKLTSVIEQVGEEEGFLYIFEEIGGLTVYKSQKSVDVAPLVKAKLGIE